jgi:hypothetical protein
MMKNWIKIFLLAVFFGIFSIVPKAFAVTITSGNFKLTSNSPLFSVTNAVPGGEYNSDFTVENIGTKTENLQMKMDIKTDPEALADVLYLKIKNKDTNICLLGCTSTLKTKDANGTELAFNNIGAGEIKNYTFILLFDINAGNEFQNSQIIFDLTLGYQGSAPVATTTRRNRGGGGGDGGGGGGNGGGGGGGTLTGGPATGILGATATGVVGGAGTPSEGTVGGA